jgi:urease accessory protein
MAMPTTTGTTTGTTTALDMTTNTTMGMDTTMLTSPKRAMPRATYTAQAAATTTERTLSDTLASADRPPLTSSALLQLIWLASPGLPVGGFSYSEGLEAAVDAGLADREDTARQWLLDQLHLTQARSELPAVAAAFRAWQAHELARVQALNDWVLATRETAEGRQQCAQMGRSLADWLRQRSADADADALSALRPAPSWPVAFALAAARSGADVHSALCAMAFGWAENLVQAAVKAVPLGQSAGQRMLGSLSEAIPAAVDAALRLDDDTRQAFSPGLAILSARHEAQYSRLFRS